MFQFEEPGLMTNNPQNWSPWADKHDMTEFLQRKVYSFWPGAEEILDKLMFVPVASENVPDCEDLIENLMPVLDSTMTMVLSGEFQYFKMYNDAISTEYYEEILLGDMDRLTYIFMLGCSPYALSRLLYYVDKRFLPQFIKNSIIRPNLQRIINQCRVHIFRKTNMEQEQSAIEKLGHLVFECCQDYMINHRFEDMETTMKEIAEIDIPEKAFYVRSYAESLTFFVPEFFIDDLGSEDPIMTFYNDPRLNKFMHDLARTHTMDRLLDLCYDYCKPEDKKYQKTRIENLYIERRQRQHVDYCPEIDGLSYKELQILDRLRKGNATEEDQEFIKSDQKMLNIQSIVDREVGLSDIVDVDNDYVTIHKEDGTAKKINYASPTFKYQYNDAFIRLFGQDDGTQLKQAVYKEGETFNKLESTGITEKEYGDIIASGKRFDPKGMNADARIKHRKNMIEKLIKQSKNPREMRMFQKRRLGTIEQPKLEYLTANDITNDLPFLVEKDPELLCYKLIELDKLHKFVSEQNKYLFDNIKKEELDKIEAKNRKVAVQYADDDDAIVYLDPEDVEYIKQNIPVNSLKAIELKYPNNPKIKEMMDIQNALYNEYVDEQKRKHEVKDTIFNHIPKITNARL